MKPNGTKTTSAVLTIDCTNLDSTEIEELELVVKSDPNVSDVQREYRFRTRDSAVLTGSGGF